MDIEFHYYMTYLIAARAGFPPEEARTLAHACQHVDDNCYLISVDADSPETAYTNYISQTLDITRPRKAMLRVYPAFHFVPGDPVEKGAARKDGLMHKLNTTPAGANAVEMLESALVSVNIYRIGIACHAYADTWAHQNFAGYHHEFNEMSGPDYKRLVPCIGHGEAGHNPDIPGLVWEDPRLQVPEVDNRERFAAAARDLYVRLKEYRDGDASDAEALVDDLRSAIGDPDESGVILRCGLQGIVIWRLFPNTEERGSRIISRLSGLRRQWRQKYAAFGIPRFRRWSRISSRRCSRGIVTVGAITGPIHFQTGICFRRP